VSERLIQSLHALAKSEDPTRPTTYASFHSEADVNLALPGQKPVNYRGEPQRWYTDLTAFNKYYGWYYGEPGDNAEFFDSMHRRNPGQRLGVSEYGAGGSIRQHEEAAYGGPGYPRVPMETMRPRAFAKEHPEGYQAYYHEEAWRALKGRDYLWCKFIWNMFDFAVDWRDEGDTPGRNDKGMVTFDRRTRKDAFFFYQASWTNTPVLHVTARRFTPRTSPVTEVKVYSNAPEVELFLNGKSLGKRSSDDRIFRWAGVTLAPGENRVRAEAVLNGARLTDECVWQLVPAATASR
jgi:beta-galactosidase